MVGKRKEAVKSLKGFCLSFVTHWSCQYMQKYFSKYIFYIKKKKCALPGIPFSNTAPGIRNEMRQQLLFYFFSVNATVRMFAELQFAIRTSLFSSIGYIGISRKGKYWTISFSGSFLIYSCQTLQIRFLKKTLMKSLQSVCMFADAQSILASEATTAYQRIWIKRILYVLHCVKVSNNKY